MNDSGLTVDYYDEETGKQHNGYAVIGYNDHDHLIPGALPLSADFYFYENEKGGHEPWGALSRGLQDHISDLLDEENEQLARNRR